MDTSFQPSISVKIKSIFHTLKKKANKFNKSLQSNIKIFPQMKIFMMPGWNDGSGPWMTRMMKQSVVILKQFC